jgi:nucleoside-diphosphate-sugar epimerase
MRILVIGGTGFLGVPLVQQLTAMGHEVAVFHRGQPSRTCSMVSRTASATASDWSITPTNCAVGRPTSSST